MATLDKRITALETKANPAGNTPKTVFIVLVTPGDTENNIGKLRQTGPDARAREWVRGAGETEQDFKDRASREATRNAWGFAMLLQCD